MGSSSSTNVRHVPTVAEAMAAAAAPSANLPKKETVLRKKVDSAAKTGVLNLSDLVRWLPYPCAKRFFDDLKLRTFYDIYLTETEEYVHHMGRIAIPCSDRQAQNS